MPGMPPGAPGGLPDASQMQAQNNLAAMMWQMQMAGAHGNQMMPPWAPPPQTPLVLNVRVEGLKFEYQLTEDDVRKVFSRYGDVAHVTVDREGVSSTVQFKQSHHAVAAQHDLDKKQLAGMSGAYLLVDFAQPAYDPAMAQMAAMQAAAAQAAQAYPGAPPQGYPPMPGYPPAGVPGYPPVMPQDSGPGNQFPPGGGVGGPGGGVGGGGAGAGRPKKYTCKLEVGIENESDFRVGSRVIQVARVIWQEPRFQQHGGKTRLRGKGVGGPHEADEPLALCISCQDQAAFERAVQVAETQLQKVYADYRIFCQQKGKEVPDLTMKVSRKGGGPPFGDYGDYGSGAGVDGSSGAPARGERPSSAPADDDIEKLIEERNEARKAANYKRSDEIREHLKQLGVVLMDEKGAKGNLNGNQVTQWRFWRP